MKNIIILLLVCSFQMLNGQSEELEKINSNITELNNQFEKLTKKSIQFGLSIGYRYLTKKSAEEYQIVSISPIDSTLRLNQIEDSKFVLSTSVIFNPKLNAESLSRSINTQIYSFIIDNNSASTMAEISTTDNLILSELYPKEKESFPDNTQVSQLSKYLSGDETQKNKIDPVLIFNFLSELRKKAKTTQDDNERKEIKKLRRRVRRLMLGRFLIDYIVDRLSISANLNLIEFSSAQKELNFNKSIEGGLGISYLINPNLHFGINWENFFSRQLHNNLKELDGEKIEINGNTILSSSDLDTENDDLFINRNLGGISFKIITTF